MRHPSALFGLGVNYSARNHGKTITSYSGTAGARCHCHVALRDADCIGHGIQKDNGSRAGLDLDELGDRLGRRPDAEHVRTSVAPPTRKTARHTQRDTWRVRHAQ